MPSSPRHSSIDDIVEEISANGSAREGIPIKAVAKLMRCSTSQIYRLKRKGLLRGHLIGERGIRIYVDSIRAYQENNPAGDAPPKAQTKPQRRSAAHAKSMAALKDLGCL